MSEDDLAAHFRGDPAFDNLLLNKWEFVHGRTELKSYPWRISVPFVLCNARCDFCAAWHIKGKAPLLDLVRDLTPAVRHAWQIDLVGWGEPLVHPEFPEILATLRAAAHAKARFALTTNGTRLDLWLDDLIAAGVTEYAISMHAARADTHVDLMGLPHGAFDRVVDAVQMLTRHRHAIPELSVELAFVVTRQNIEEIPEFLELAERMGANSVHLRTLMPAEKPRPGLDYHRLPPYLHPRFEELRDQAIEAIARSPLTVRGEPSTWSRPLYPEVWESRISDLPITPRHLRSGYELFMSQHDWPSLGEGQPCQDPFRDPPDDLYGRQAPFACASPYTAFYINGTDRRVIPCVYMLNTPGHDFMHLKPGMPFEAIWNAPAMSELRRRLRHGPLMPMCLKCPADC